MGVGSPPSTGHFIQVPFDLTTTNFPSGDRARPTTPSGVIGLVGAAIEIEQINVRSMAAFAAYENNTLAVGKKTRAKMVN